MEKIYFDKSTFIWKKKLNFSNDKEILLKEIYSLIKSEPNNKRDAYTYKHISHLDINFNGIINLETKLDEIVQIGIDSCKQIVDNSIKYNKLNTDVWANIVRSKNPIQGNFYDKTQKYHIHTEIQSKLKSFRPDFTYVYYIQMPDIMNGDDGVLFFKGENDKEYWIRPEEDDLIIMKADVPHAPNNAPNANIDRIVLAGNVGFDYIKKEKTLF